jgi:hypothetical protein
MHARQPSGGSKLALDDWPNEGPLMVPVGSSAQSHQDLMRPETIKQLDTLLLARPTFTELYFGLGLVSQLSDRLT